MMFSIKRSIPRVLGRRTIHVAPKLKNQIQYETVGIQGLYSKEGFKLAWVDTQNYLTRKLTLLTNGTIDETRYPFHIAINTAKDSTKQPIFNAASQAHNNHFFFQQLISSTENNSSPSRDLERRIQTTFGSVDGMTEALIDESKKIVGQGWVFLVETETKELELLSLNNSGTPYNFSGNLSLDLNGPISQDKYEVWELIKENTLAKTKDWTVPLISINLWDHAYITDFGVDGREEYIRSVIKALDWDVVNKRIYVSA